MFGVCDVAAASSGAQQDRNYIGQPLGKTPPLHQGAVTTSHVLGFREKSEMQNFLSRFYRDTVGGKRIRGKEIYDYLKGMYATAHMNSRVRHIRNNLLRRKRKKNKIRGDKRMNARARS